MAIKPILFSTQMVKAFLAGNKTVTRRVIKPQPEGTTLSALTASEDCRRVLTTACAPYRPGDVLYVRETWDNRPVTPGGHFRPNGAWHYKADGDLRPEAWRGNWNPSIYMPKEAARIFLRVMDVRVERLQDITEDEAIAEGVDPSGGNLALDDFEPLWDSTIKKPADRALYGWAANPWVWVIEFERVGTEEVQHDG